MKIKYKKKQRTNKVYVLYKNKYVNALFLYTMMKCKNILVCVSSTAKYKLMLWTNYKLKILLNLVYRKVNTPPKILLSKGIQFFGTKVLLTIIVTNIIHHVYSKSYINTECFLIFTYYREFNL